MLPSGSTHGVMGGAPVKTVPSSPTNTLFWHGPDGGVQMQPPVVFVAASKPMMPSQDHQPSSKPFAQSPEMIFVRFERQGVVLVRHCLSVGRSRRLEARIWQTPTSAVAEALSYARLNAPPRSTA